MSGQTVTGSQAEVKDARGRRPGNRPRGEREGDPPTACLLTEASWPTLVGRTYRPSSLNPGISTYPSLKTYMLGGRSSPSRYLRATSPLISTSARRPGPGSPPDRLGLAHRRRLAGPRGPVALRDPSGPRDRQDRGRPERRARRRDRRTSDCNPRRTARAQQRTVHASSSYLPLMVNSTCSRL